MRFKNDLIVVRRLEDGPDLPRAERVEQLVADLVGGDAVDGRLLAVDLDREFGVLDVEVGRHVEQARNLRDLVSHRRRDRIEAFDVAALQGVLVLALGDTTADVEVLDALEEGLHAGHLRRLLPQPRDDDRRRITLGLRFQPDEHASVVGGRIRSARADGRVEEFDRRIGANNRIKLGLSLDHCVERGVGGGFRDARQETGVLLREEALWHDIVEIDGQADGRERHHQHHALGCQHLVQRPFVGTMPLVEHRLENPQHDVGALMLVMRFQDARAQHRRQRQRHEARNDDRHRHRHRELAEHAADDAAHQQHRDEDGDQRKCDRHDGEADFAGALQRGLDRAACRSRYDA